ncbi:ZIP family metal transporter [Candidatus Woesearchaeota archaeon]|nr:ZIP family metal transporter [Candidatus Woesearchaeota archaeon]
MANEWIYSLVSVGIVSLVSLIGILFLSLNVKKLNSIVLFLVSFSAGALFADAFIHLLPEAVREYGFGVELSLYVLSGIMFFFVVEKFIHWHHCHLEPNKHHPHPFAYMNLLGDAVHNFIDGLIIGASYLVNTPTGIATTLAVVLHEVPQEIGDFGVLLHGGFSKSKALLMNFLTSLTAVLGTVLALFLNNHISNLSAFLVPFAAGGFIYIAGSDLIPELHKEEDMGKSFIQLITFLLGIAVMLVLLLVE